MWLSGRTCGGLLAVIYTSYPFFQPTCSLSPRHCVSVASALQVDFEEDMMRSAFAVVNNPASESACGCGSSFAIKNFEKNPALD